MRKRREEKMLFSLMLVIILVLLTVIAAGVAFWIVLQGKNAYVGKWNTELSYDDEIKYAVDMWIHEEEDEADALYEYDAVNMPTLDKISLSLVMDKDGKWYCELSDNSYELCEKSAYEYAANALTETIARKLIASGYNGQDPYQDAKELAGESVGGDLEKYLAEVMPKVLPAKETISEIYAGEGSYIFDKKSQTILFTDSLGNSFTVNCVMNQNQMVFTSYEGELGRQYEEREYPIVWNKEQ